MRENNEDTSDLSRISRYEVFRLFIWRRWKALILALYGFISIYDIFLSQLVPQSWTEGLQRVIDIVMDPGIPWYWWVIGLLLVLMLLLFEGAYTEIRKRHQELALVQGEPPELEELGRLRTEGTRMRNDWARLSDQDELPDFQQIYEDWNERMLTTVAGLSPGRATWLRTLDRWRWRYRSDLGNDHERYLNIVDEKLRRLDVILKRYLGLE